MSSEPQSLQEQAAAINAAREEVARKRAEDHPLIIAERLLRDREKHLAVIEEYRGVIDNADAVIDEAEDKIRRIEHSVAVIASAYRRRTKAAKLQLRNHFLEINKVREKTAVNSAALRSWIENHLPPEELERFTRRRQVEEIDLAEFKRQLHFNQEGEAIWRDVIVPGIKKTRPAADEYTIKIHRRGDGDADSI